MLEDLRERSFGRLDGWTVDAVKQSEWAPMRAAWRMAVPGGETLAAVAARAVRTLEVRGVAAVTVVVTHAGVIRTLVGLLDGTPTSEIGRLRVPHAEPWVRAVTPGAWARITR